MSVAYAWRQSFLPVTYFASMKVSFEFTISCLSLVVDSKAFAPWHSPSSRLSAHFIGGGSGSGSSRLYDSVNGDSDETTDPFAEKRRKLLENATPKLPDTGTPPSKADVYNDEQLQNLWDIHKQISPQTGASQSTKDIWEETGIPSIHDIVMNTVDEISDNTKNDGGNNNAYPWFTDEIRQRSRNIKAIASDVDGTLIGSDQTVHPKTKAAIQKAVEAAFSPMEPLKSFFLATGKTRAGALNSLGPDVASLLSECPGVFIQGLYCLHGDKVIFEKKLTRNAVAACEKLVEATGTSIIAYDGDDLYTTDLTQTVINLNEIYGEPLSKEIPSIADHAAGVHKILVCDEDPDKLVNIVRPQLEDMAAANNARVTQAVPTMLELIPEGCSKALGVQKLCEVLGLDPTTDLLALGDAENDVEMLQMAAIGVVMGNGTPPAREAGDVVLEETSDQGGAGLAMEVLGGLK